MFAYIKYLSGNLALIVPMDEMGVDPGFGVGIGGHPDTGLPARPGRPDNNLPTAPGAPDNTLPPPPMVAAGQTLVIVRGPNGRWAYATIAQGVVPTPLPTPPAPAPAPKG